ncbi:MAG: putative membrane protein [Flavobacterium sp.]|jgi:putative membrane protein
MNIVAQIITVFVALLHFCFLYFEMFAWTTIGPKKIYDFPKDLFPKTKEIAANQSFYNRFLASCLVWSLFITDVIWSKNAAVFFLFCVLITGIYGAFTVSKKISTKYSCHSCNY